MIRGGVFLEGGALSPPSGVITGGRWTSWYKQQASTQNGHETEGSFNAKYAKTGANAKGEEILTTNTH